MESFSELTDFGRLPLDWYLDERDAICRYDGEVLLAFALEAYPYTPMFHHVADIITQFPHFADAVGMLPDLQATRYLVGITREDVAEILNVSIGLVEAWEAGVVPISGKAASLLCRSMDWPFAALVRGINDWHPRTRAELYGRGDQVRVLCAERPLQCPCNDEASFLDMGPFTGEEIENPFSFDEEDANG
jgi:transcriptional regulator with XRE-family HTH domain